MLDGFSEMAVSDYCTVEETQASVRWRNGWWHNGNDWIYQ